MQGAGRNIPTNHKFLEFLRTAVTRAGTVLIYDKIITSKFHKGELQEYHGIYLDMTTVATRVAASEILTTEKLNQCNTLDEKLQDGINKIMARTHIISVPLDLEVQLVSSMALLYYETLEQKWARLPGFSATGNTSFLHIMPIGETKLTNLLRTLSPILSPETYVFATTTQSLSSLPLTTLQPILIFHEVEGLTLITTKESANTHGLEYTFPCKKISLKVHSSLEAVGMMAAISAKFTDLGISSNVVSGFFHDHIFVPEGKEGVAMRGLAELMREAMEDV
ncbi:hypothetical protein TSTA_056180 [Talaromyces stipitatus ATCC 10500]|uniref:DUF2241 domain-containing protein n=1 Tax=Talaromyces stipitatus (strain ATCC 10500 / CBS 375.48 / QM 6759 / NRRL 1006) TaxID=441959 RepID=B8MRI2_TALSN|nr:uncharacterized protein TSTA_056180 [Talaromyces stipitatus ATCC 10500]EED13119.1 hypothetical protein TSTA_056180 [Talaromyces stipitatus ATCC 10500]